MHGCTVDWANLTCAVARSPFWHNASERVTESLAAQTRRGPPVPIIKREKNIVVAVERRLAHFARDVSGRRR